MRGTDRKRRQTSAQLAYNAGRVALCDGMGKAANPYGASDMRLERWWLAGWNDADIEQGAK